VTHRMVNHTDRVAAVVIPKTSKKEEYPVAKRADNGDWEFPGGKEDQDKDNTIRATAEREGLEVLKLEVEAAEHIEQSSYKGGSYDIIPVLAEHNHASPDKHIELVDHTEYRWIKPENPDVKLGKEIKCLKAFDIV